MSTYLDFWTFGWVTPLLKRSYRRRIEPHEIYDLPAPDEAHIAFEAFRSSSSPTRSFFGNYVYHFRWEFVVSILYFVVRVALNLALPVLMQEFLAYLEDPAARPKSHAYLCVIAMFVCGLVSNVLYQQALFIGRHISFQSRSIFINELCLKALHRDSKKIAAGEDNSRSGRIVNLLGSDTRKMSKAIACAVHTLHEPATFALSLVLLYRLMGQACG